MSTCLITGCDLWVPAEGKLLHGDLHVVGDTYVFNGIVHQGETMWQHVATVGGFDPEYLQKNLISIIGDYFDRRGVVCVPSKAAQLNKFAREYVQKWNPV